MANIRGTTDTSSRQTLCHLREMVSATLQHFLEQFDLSPAFAIGSRWDIVAWNEAARLVLYDFPRVRGRELNIIWRTFISVEHRQMVIDWEKHARRILAQFRTSYGRFPGDPYMTALVQDLLAASPEFRVWWPDHEVLRGPEGIKEFNHPRVGHLAFEHLMFQVYNEPDLKVIVYTPLKEGETAAKIRQLLAMETHSDS